jgi:hypothetical protein
LTFLTEHTATGWYATEHDISDPSNNATGIIRFLCANGGLGSYIQPSIDGGAGLTVISLFSGDVRLAPGSGGGGTTGGAKITGKGTVPSLGTSGQVLVKNSSADYDYGWATPVGYGVRSDDTNYVAGLAQVNSNTASVSASYAADTYLAGSAVVVAAGDFKAKGQYRCIFDMVKTNVGTATPIITVRVGTAGTSSDTAQLTFTFGAGTAVADTGTFEVIVNWRSVGSGTSAVVQGICRGQHNLATTGLFNNAAAWTIVGTPSSGFNSSTATTIGVSFNGGSSFSGTNTVVQAILEQP